MTDPSHRQAPAVLAGPARLVRPVLAVAAFILLLLVVPGRERHPALRAAEAFLGDGLDVRAPWMHWSLQRAAPPAETVILHFARTGP